MCDHHLVTKSHGNVFFFRSWMDSLFYLSNFECHQCVTLSIYSLGHTETERTTRIPRRHQVLSVYARGIFTFFDGLGGLYLYNKYSYNSTCAGVYRHVNHLACVQNAMTFSKQSLQSGSTIMTHCLSCRVCFCFKRLCCMGRLVCWRQFSVRWNWNNRH
jgi:hypothetical protein